MKLRPAVKAAWLHALRSGDYVQTSHVLKSHETEGPSYCCLGVLCDIAVKDGYGNWLTADSDLENFYEDPDGITESGLPPDAIVTWAFDTPQWEAGAFSVPSPAGVDSDGTGFVHLADLNDSYGYSFEQIADVIEEHM